MRRLELVCDNCGEVAKGDEYHYGLPKGWYVVGYHCQSYVAYDDWRVIGHYCSSDCLTNVTRVDGKERKAEKKST